MSLIVLLHLKDFFVKLKTKNNLLTVHIFFNLQNHPTFQTEERLVNLVNGRECFVGLLYSVQYLRSYILLVYDVISLLLLGIMSVDTSSVCDCFLLNIFMPYSPWLISNYTHTHEVIENVTKESQMYEFFPIRVSDNRFYLRRRMAVKKL